MMVVRKAGFAQGHKKGFNGGLGLHHHCCFNQTRGSSCERLASNKCIVLLERMVYQAIYLLFSNPKDGLKDSLLQMNGRKL